jgi:hypothetical protein
MKIQALSIRTKLFPDEFLPSFLERLARRNFLNSGKKLRLLLWHHLKERGQPPDHWSRPRFADTYAILADLTRVSIDDLYRATGHFLVTSITPLYQEVTMGSLPSALMAPMILGKGLVRVNLHVESRLQFCPHCLRENGYISRDWLPLVITACPKHHCLLVKTCDRCEAYLHTRDLIRGRCPRCEKWVTDIQTIELPPHSLGLRSQEWLHYWLGQRADCDIDCPLPTMPIRAIYSLVSGLRRCLILTPTLSLLAQCGDLSWIEESPAVKGTSSNNLCPVNEHALTTLAVWATMNWPRNFYRLLDAYTEALQKEDRRGPSKRLGVLYTVYLEKTAYWKHPACGFIQAAFNQYIIDNSHQMSLIQNNRRYRHMEELRNQCATVGILEASRILQINEQKLRQLVRDGRFQIVEPHHYRVTLDRQAVIELSEKWNRSFIQNEQVAEFLGIPGYVVRQLQQMGICNCSA